MGDHEMKKVLTLTIVHRGNQVLLGLKKRGFGAGRWNGFGGKVEKGEEIKVAARRELREEAGITAKSLHHLGTIEFRWRGKDDVLEVHVFKAHAFRGIPEESDEMRPEWFELDKIPFKEMWSDDRYWFPLFLKGRPFEASFEFDNRNEVLKYKVRNLSLPTAVVISQSTPSINNRRLKTARGPLPRSASRRR